MRNEELYLDKPLVYKVKTDPDEIAMKCDLCLDFTCCPEHCCDVSTFIIKSNKDDLINLSFRSGTLANADTVKTVNQKGRNAQALHSAKFSIQEPLTKN